MSKAANPFQYSNSLPEVIRLVVILYAYRRGDALAKRKAMMDV